MNWILISCPDLGSNFGMIQNVGKVSSMYPNPLGSSSNKEYNLGAFKMSVSWTTNWSEIDKFTCLFWSRSEYFTVNSIEY